MHFAERFIRRPVLASMVSLGLVLVGAIGYTRLPVREFPDADPPIVSVTVLLPGASPQVVESAVTDVLEEELSSVEGLRTMTSASQEQISTITLEFTLDREIEAAAQDVRDKVSRVRGFLPEDVEEPVIAKQEADAFPIMFLALTSKTLRADGAVGHRGPTDQAAAADDPRRVGCADLWRAALRHARVALAARAGRARADRAGRRERDPHAQRGDPGGPHRVGPPRVLRAIPRRDEDARRVRRPHCREQGRRARQARRRRARGAGPGRRAVGDAVLSSSPRSSLASCGSPRRT